MSTADGPDGTEVMGGKRAPLWVLRPRDRSRSRRGVGRECGSEGGGAGAGGLERSALAGGATWKWRVADVEWPDKECYMSCVWKLGWLHKWACI